MIGWHELSNGELLRQAEEAGYDLLLTTDKNTRYQQWPDVKLHLDRISAVVNAATPGSYTEVEIPRKS